ncbi:MAG TPA: methylated-DNA--[protein]-cysteine S-methyltransferase [Anaerolineales bacterium]
MNAIITDNGTQSEDYARIEQAIGFLEKNFREQPSLKDIAGSIGLSEYHFQRLFTRWVGISPKRFVQFLTKEYAKEMLRQSENLLDVTYEAGLSSPGRLHDLFVACDAVTPGEYKNRGEGLVIQYGFHPSPFGECLLGVTERGICSLSFVGQGGQQQALAQLQARWRQAELRLDPEATAPWVLQIFTAPEQRSAPLPVFLKGTNFQIKVWEALINIPSGSVVSYEDIAVSIGMPDAARAVSNAVGSNPIPVLIPCHRVIRKDGRLGGYHYGTARKKALLGWEWARKSG